MNDHDFGVVSGAHRGPPEAGAARGVERVISFRVQAVVIPSKHQPGNELEGKDLALMNVPGKLQVDARRLRLRDLGGAVVEQDRGQVWVKTGQLGHLLLKSQRVAALRIADSD